MRCDIEGILLKFREQLCGRDVTNVAQLEDYFGQMDPSCSGQLGPKGTIIHMINRPFI